jgi:hypothetical protein
MTIISCPHCGEAPIDTNKQQACGVCRRLVNETLVKIHEGQTIFGMYAYKESWCGEFYQCRPELKDKFMCRRPKGHDGEHCEHEDGTFGSPHKAP